MKKVLLVLVAVKKSSLFNLYIKYFIKFIIAGRLFVCNNFIKSRLLLCFLKFAG